MVQIRPLAEVVLQCFHHIQVCAITVLVDPIIIHALLFLFLSGSGVVVAYLLGFFETMSIFQEEFDSEGGWWDFIANINFDYGLCCSLLVTLVTLIPSRFCCVLFWFQLELALWCALLAPSIHPSLLIHHPLSIPSLFLSFTSFFIIIKLFAQGR